ncbi:ATP-binding cassette domain-containing protein [Acidimangrovimonas sediminis]|uniref:ATP-binding cassette domain-containing protein n=1 Tax=Acidimangrovimonas sediminis TaxID=2056283 RepID=UPI000C80C296|nr:ATP-binding cassette domain-containing protein [Acidimangrovimonas sediminis]
MLELRNATCRAGGRLGGRALVRRLSAGFAPGTVNVVIGPNGAGKTTMLRLLSGERAADEGKVLLDGVAVQRLGARALATRRAVLAQFTPEGFSYTAHEVVRLGSEAPTAGRAVPPWTGPESALAAVDLEGFGGRLVTELSGGEVQRVHLARVLCQLGSATGPEGARYLLLDEPIASLDIRHQVLVMEIARAFARAGGCVVVILHDLNIAARYADRLVLMEEGEISASGSAGEILTADRLTRAYGLPLTVRVVTGEGDNGAGGDRRVILPALCAS